MFPFTSVTTMASPHPRRRRPQASAVLRGYSIRDVFDIQWSEEAMFVLSDMRTFTKNGKERAAQGRQVKTQKAPARSCWSRVETHLLPFRLKSNSP